MWFIKRVTKFMGKYQMKMKLKPTPCGNRQQND